MTKKKEEIEYLIIKEWDMLDHIVTVETEIVDMKLSPPALALYINLIRSWKEYKNRACIVDKQLIKTEAAGCVRTSSQLAEAINSTVTDIAKAKTELQKHELIIITETGEIWVR